MKKVLNIISGIFVWLVVAFTIFMMVFTIISVTTFDQNNRSLLGFKAFIVQSDSMSATDFDAGDIVLIKEVDPAVLEEGDIIAFISSNPENYGGTVTHKIRRLTTDKNGNPGFVTYGTTTDTDDQTIVTYASILGRYEGRIPKVGYFFQFLKTPLGYICCILVPFGLVILYQALNCVRLFRKYKSEQMNEMKAEREKLEAERKQTAEMMQELMILKAQLEQQSKKEETPSEEQKEEAGSEQ